jgi:hypothetical protein
LFCGYNIKAADFKPHRNPKGWKVYIDDGEAKMVDTRDNEVLTEGLDGKNYRLERQYWTDQITLEISEIRNESEKLCHIN